ncbi:hypothetical protein Hanom_Chr14g01320821 [Helianthus anomalus]
MKGFGNRNGDRNENCNRNRNRDADLRPRVSVSSCNGLSDGGGRPSSVTPSPAWWRGRQSSVTSSNGGVRKQRCVSDRGMSPVRTDEDVSDGSSANESAESCKQTPMKIQVCRGGGQKRVTELIFCPLVSASPHQMLNVKGKPPVDCGYSGDVRAPELMKLMKQIFELYASNSQRLQTCQTFSDHEGLSQQSLVIQTPKYHKQYLLPVVRAPGMAELKISLAKPGLRSDGVSVWEWLGSALDEGDEAAKWFTDFLRKPSRLVRFNEGTIQHILQ